MQKEVVLVLLLILLVGSVNAQEGDVFSDIENAELKEDAGLTPDDFFYFLDDFLESAFVGENPERALKYKEEKIAEAKEMFEQGKLEEAKTALKNVGTYGDILEKEVSPELEKQVRESSKAINDALTQIESNLEGAEFDELRGIINEHVEKEIEIAVAAKISTQIKQLCESLSKLDPLEYARVCKTDEDDPNWKQELDLELTSEQEQEAKDFFGVMSQCFENPRECPCDQIKIKSFADKCSLFAPLAADCEEGDESACEKMEDIGDPIELLPPHLQRAMQQVEDKFGDAQHDLHVPRECQEAGAIGREDCMRVMFRLNAPDECVQAFENGRIDIDNEREAREACERIMFEADAPRECIDAGLTDHRECGLLMFELDAPQECLDAGLTGEGRRDWEECDAIRFEVEAPRECLDAGINGNDRDAWKKCDAIQFKTEAPRSCLDAGIDPNDRDAWDKCQVIEFRENAPRECLAAGLDGHGRNDWAECDKINFRNNADPKCLEAGLTGGHVDDWKRCEEITFREEDHFDQGFRGPDCNSIEDANEKLICFEDFYNAAAGGQERTFDPTQEVLECHDGCFDECGGQRWECGQQGECLCFEDDFPHPEENECFDGCYDECGDARWECSEVGTCLCFEFEEPEQTECFDGCYDECGNDQWTCGEQGECNCHPRVEEPYDGSCEDGCDAECGVNVGWTCGSIGECICHIREDEPYDGSCEDGCSDECGPAAWNCGPIGECVCQPYDEPKPTTNECSDGCGQECGDAAWDCNSGYCNCHEPEPIIEEIHDEPEPEIVEETHTESANEPAPEPEPTPEPDAPPITGEVVFDNDFLEYYYR